MGIQINGNNDIISALDGSWTAEGASINTSGILTATTFKGNIVGTAATFTGPVTIGGTLTYEDVTNIDSVGLITARSGIKDQTLTAGRVVYADSDKTLTDSANLTYNGSKLNLAANSTAYDAFQVGDGLFIGNTTNNASAAIFHQGGGADLEVGAQDMITFTTGSTAGNATERLRITSDGKIGINQTTWTDKDHMFEVAQSTNDKEIARFTNLGGVSGSVKGKGFIGLSVFNGTTYPHASIGVEENNNATHKGALTFATRNVSSDSAPEERMRIASTGKVGVGTDNPVGNLEVRDSKANLIVAKDGLPVKSNGDLAASYDMIQLGAGGALASYSATSVTADTMFIHNAYRHSGNNWKRRYQDTAARMRVNSPANTWIFETAVTGNADSTITSWDESLRIDSSGNVGINETDPDNKLHLTTNNDTDYSTNTNNTQNITNALLKLQNLSGTDNSGVNNYVGIQFSVANGANSTAQLNYVRTGNNAGAFQFKARNASSTYPNLMTITSAGKVGINSTTPAHQLDVVGNIRAHNADPALYLQSTNNASNTCLIRMGDSGSFQRASISYDLNSGFMMWKLGGAGNNVEHMRYDGANNRLHIGKRDGNSNSTHWSTARVSIVGPDPIATSVTKAASYLAIGNNESELNGVYPITFGYTNNSNSHQPAYIAYKTTNAGSAECGDLLFATRNVITDTAPTERLRITSGGQLIQNTNHTSGTSAHQNTGWYNDDANHYTLEYADFNEIYAVKTHNVNDYNSIVYKREKMTEYCDIEFTMTCNAPSGTTYRHLGFAINGDGSDTWSNMDRLVVRHRPGNTANNQIRLDKGGGGYGFNLSGSSYPSFADGTERHWHIQIRKRTFVVTVDGTLVGSFRSNADLVRSHGFFGFCLYEAGSTSPSIRIRDFKLRNHTAQAIPGNSVAFQASIASGNPSKSSGYVVKPANNEHFDNGFGGGNYNTSNYRFTAPVAGTYYFRQTLNVYSSPGGMFASLRVNGSTQYIGTKRNDNAGSGDQNSVTSCIIQLERGDYVEAYDNTSNSVTYSSGVTWNRFEGHLVAAYK